MHATAGCINARHSDSTLTLGSGDSLDLSKLADKVFAAELASLYSGLKAQQERPDDNEVGACRTWGERQEQLPSAVLLGLMRWCQVSKSNMRLPAAGCAHAGGHPGWPAGTGG